MKQSVFMTMVLVVSLALGFVIWMQLPDYLKQGGYLVAVLIALSIMRAVKIASSLGLLSLLINLEP